MNPLINVGVQAAQAAGQIIARAIDSDLAPTIITKGDNDFATEVDLRAEKKIIDIIHKSFPNHAIYAEESGITKGSEIVWIIDPLDGTSNFIHGFPHVCVSIAAMRDNVIEAAIIFDPVRQEMFTAAKGFGARLNEKRIRVSKCAHFKNALIATGLPFSKSENNDAEFALLKRMHPDCSGFRRAGSAALDLAYVAAGRLDGFFEKGLKPWDIAAGGLLVKEAGGYVTGMQQEDNFLEAAGIVAGNPHIHKAISEYL